MATDAEVEPRGEGAACTASACRGDEATGGGQWASRSPSLPSLVEDHDGASGLSMLQATAFFPMQSPAPVPAAPMPAPEARAAELLREMTREEKYRFLRGTGYGPASSAQDPGYYVGDAGLHEKHGIPPLNMQDAGQGFRTSSAEMVGTVTSWPCALAVASTWSEALVGKWAASVAREFLAKGANMLLGPGLNVHRVPHGGRNAEYLPGESPYLGARLAAPYVQGVQSQSVLAVMKHFVANSQENFREESNSEVDQRTLWEVYYPPFQAAADAGCAAAMCGYNLVNGKHSCENEEVLVRDLKRSMGFDGWVMSDWWATHEFAADEGLDQEMPGNGRLLGPVMFTDEHLDTLSDEKIDAMVAPMLIKMLRYGLFENPVCEPPDCKDIETSTNATSAEHQALSRELATESVLLLKNEHGLLPLGAGVRRIALLGSACDAPHDIEGMLYDWTKGDYYVVGGSGRVIGANPVSILAGLRAQCAQRGCEVIFEGSDDVEAAADAAADADMVFVCAGVTSHEMKDRETLSVDQEDFVIGVTAAVSPPVATLTMTAGAIVMPWIDSVGAALNIFLAGDHTGSAFADVVFGNTSPSAKSPVTFPRHEGDVTAPCPDLACNYTEGLFVGFHGLEGKDVTFPFGHGLSYTNFDYVLLDVAVVAKEDVGLPEDCRDAVLCVRARITNAGAVVGVEVPQLYLGFPDGLGEPPKVLRGFARTPKLSPSASADVAFPLRARDLEIFDPAAAAEGAWRSPDGVFTISIGASSRDLRLFTSFSLCGGGARTTAAGQSEEPCA